MSYNITVPSGIVFNFTNMLGEGRLSKEEVEQALAGAGRAADAAVAKLRETGFSKAHLSKDGTPEHVYFPRMPYIKEGNPNTEASIIKLLRYGFGKLSYAFRPYGLQQIEVRLYRIAFACELVACGDKHQHNILIKRPDTFGSFNAAHSAHIYVKKNQIVSAGGKLPEQFLAACIFVYIAYVQPHF